MESKTRDGLNRLQSFQFRLCQCDFCCRVDIVCPGGTQVNDSQKSRLNLCPRHTLGSQTQLGICIPHAAVAIDSLPDNKPINMGAGSCTQLGSCFKATLAMLSGEQIPASLPVSVYSQMLVWRTSTQLLQVEVALQLTQDPGLGMEAGTQWDLLDQPMVPKFLMLGMVRGLVSWAHLGPQRSLFFVRCPQRAGKSPPVSTPNLH